MDGRSLLATPGGLTAVALLGFLTWSLTKKSKPRLPFPPGPKPLPVIGNLLDMPHENDWLVYQQWAQKYGDVVHVEALGQHTVILNSAKAVKELFERRSTIYSSRPKVVMMGELMAFADSVCVVMGYGEMWRRQRQVFHSQMQPSEVTKYRSVQLRQARMFLRQLREDSSALSASVRETVGATIIDVVYGIQITGKDDPYIKIVEEVERLYASAMMPGAFWVDMIPLLKYVPAWVPGAGFQRTAALTRRLHAKMMEEPVAAVEASMVEGNVTGSMTSILLEEARSKGQSDARRIIKEVSGSSYGAGSETTISTLLSFFLAMAKYPDVQEKAHAELDAVVGQDRLPEFADCPKLPYINAIISELFRWQPVLPLGIIHSTTVDDEYDGYFIPKDSVVMGNIWSILRDPKEYPEPEEFRPERFLKTTDDGMWAPNNEVRDPRFAFYGFGRRICPGRHLADQSIFAIVASVLATFSITLPLDEQGNPMPLKVEMSSGLIMHPLPFKCTIKPRSQRTIDLIDQPLPERGL